MTEDTNPYHRSIDDDIRFAGRTLTAAERREAQAMLDHEADRLWAEDQAAERPSERPSRYDE